MRTEVVRIAQRTLLLVAVVGAVAAFVSYWQAVQAGAGPGWLQRLVGPPQTLAGRSVGIVAGHSGYDAGTVCIDGLTEAAVNQAIADLVVRELERRGASVDLLEEFDARLAGYQADAFVSIHADSCRDDLDLNLSGYKAANLEGGSDASVQLTDCLWKSYAEATGLRPHPDTITYDMRDYHAFREIASITPATIVEVGFLKTDRKLLTERPERAAAGIVTGIECFLGPQDEGSLPTQDMP